MSWIKKYWQWVLLGFYVLEKAVLISPAKWDDILVSGIKATALQLFELFTSSP